MPDADRKKLAAIWRDAPKAADLEGLRPTDHFDVGATDAQDLSSTENYVLRHYERNQMPAIDVPTTEGDYEVQVRIEDSANLYVGEMARAAMQVDAMQHLNAGLTEALAVSESGIDVKDMGQINDVVWSLDRALGAAKALRALAPLPDEDDGGE